MLNVDITVTTSSNLGVHVRCIFEELGTAGFAFSIWKKKETIRKISCFVHFYQSSLYRILSYLSLALLLFNRSLYHWIVTKAKRNQQNAALREKNRLHKITEQENNAKFLRNRKLARDKHKAADIDTYHT